MNTQLLDPNEKDYPEQVPARSGPSSLTRRAFRGIDEKRNFLEHKLSACRPPVSAV